MNKKCIYSFLSKGNREVDVLGNKGHGLAEMCALGLPVPPGFTISSEMCLMYYKNGRKLMPAFMTDVRCALAELENNFGKKFGGQSAPMLLSVRSGAKVSMPGMMDTVLNLGLNDEIVLKLAMFYKNNRFAYDSYRRLIQMYANVVLGVNAYGFESLLQERKKQRKIENDSDLFVEDCEWLVEAFQTLVRKETGKDFPQDPFHQLEEAIKAVFNSWTCSRAITYRRIHNISEEWGTAVNVQAMVFGNVDKNSATGVLFTRNPSTGENLPYGEYLLNAQGEDVVAGIRTPSPIQGNHHSMKGQLPQAYSELVRIAKKLELHYQDVQDIEFTVEQGKLWILQTRSAKRSFDAQIKILVDMVAEGLITKHEAIRRIDPLSLNKLLYPCIDPKIKKNVVAKGLAASPGAVSGMVVFSANDAEKCVNAGEKVILVCSETSPEDIHGMHASQGILTSCGGMTSHAAVVARGMGKVCIVGTKALVIDADRKVIRIAPDIVIKEKDYITIDGQTGEVLLGIVATIKPTPSEAFVQVMTWADEMRKLNVRTNAETVEDIETALNFGAEGIGLCRTEHMFFDQNRITSVRRMIIANSYEQRVAALNEILPMQRGDFIKIFQLMKGKPVTIRLLDMPLHEFIPKTSDEIRQVACSGNVSVEFVLDRCNQLHEINPMLGHRGCRLAITFPEIYEMQARAIFEATIEVKNALVEIMVPLIFNEVEMKFLRNLIEGVAMKVQQETSMPLSYKIGTMIELPRAAICCDKIAPYIDFISFGTNDLSQTIFGISRDDSGTFMSQYIACGLLPTDPFVEIDEEGVGELIKIACTKAKAINPSIKIGVCGEHGGDPKSIAFFSKLGFDYVSCSPYRIQVAKLAVAQANSLHKVDTTLRERGVLHKESPTISSTA